MLRGLAKRLTDYPNVMSRGFDFRNSTFMKAQNMEVDTEVSKTLYQQLVQRHQQRLNSYVENFNMYIGHHWNQIEARGVTYKNRFIEKNYSKIIVDKHLAFLMNKGFLVATDFPSTERWLQRQYKRNKLGNRENNELGLELGLVGGITGDGWILILEDQKDVLFELLNPLKCFPILDRGKLHSFLYYGTEEIVTKANFGFSEYGELQTGYYYTPGARQQLMEDKPASDPESYVLPNIPIVHFRNSPLAFDYFGVSDLVGSNDLSKKYDEALQNIQQTIEYHASPVTVIIGAKASDLQRGANRVWSLPAGATINNLMLNSDLEAASAHLARLEEAILSQARIPSIAVRNPTSISNTAGIAVALQYMPMIEVMEQKRITYGAGFLEMNKTILKIAFLKGTLKPGAIIKEALDQFNKAYSNYDEITRKQNYPFESPIEEDNLTQYDSLAMIQDDDIPTELYESYITWQNPMPRDEKLDADMAINMVAGGLWSTRYARAYIGITDIESKEIEKEIRDDMAQAASLAGDTVVTNATRKTQEPNMNTNPDVHSQQTYDNAMNSMMK